MNSKLFFRTIFLFMVCFVSFSVDARIVKTHTVVAENPSGKKLVSAITGATKKHRFADIDVEAYWQVIDSNGSTVKCVVASEVTMLANTVWFRGFGTIRGTADAGHSNKFAMGKKGAVKTDKGVLDSAKHPDTKKYTVSASLVNEDGRPISLSKSQFTDYKKWYAQASPALQEKWGDSEGFSYKHSDNSFYTAMQEHPVHSGKG